MNKTLKIILMTLLWVFVAAFIVYFNGRAEVHRASTTIQSLDINIVDSTREEMLITSQTIERWIQQNKIATVGVPINELDVAAIENMIRANGFIRRVNAYVTYDGRLRIDVSQRRPMLRLMPHPSIGGCGHPRRESVVHHADTGGSVGGIGIATVGGVYPKLDITACKYAYQHFADFGLSHQADETTAPVLRHEDGGRHSATHRRP